jgi:3-methyladenine DNA glycosylase AlkD
MATKKIVKKTKARPAELHVSNVLAALRKRASTKTKDGMARYAIPSTNAFGVAVGSIKQLAKSLGKSHVLAEALWKTGYYEARMLATFVDEAELVTTEQMERWCHDFDNWAICDTACFALFDRTPHAFKKVAAWAKSQDEFVKRAAFALLWGLTVHDKAAPATAFLRCLPLVERAALDERNFVRKSVNMALRAVGKRSLELNRAAIDVAQRLATRPEPSARWIGKDALRELNSASVQKRLSKPRG